MKITKYLILAILSIGLLILISACNNERHIDEISTTEYSSEHIEQNLDIGGADEQMSSPFDGYKYRAIYYDVPAPFADLVDEDAYWDWLENETPYRKYPRDNIEEMAMVAFVKRFNISRQDFDKANEKYKQILLEYGGMAFMNPAEEDPYYDRDKETHEVYNADIIYTFDNELINAYYLYVDPYEDESSTVGDGVLDVPNDETTSEPVSETAPAEVEIPTETSTAKESTTTEETTAN